MFFEFSEKIEERHYNSVTLQRGRRIYLDSIFEGIDYGSGPGGIINLRSYDTKSVKSQETFYKINPQLLDSNVEERLTIFVDEKGDCSKFFVVNFYSLEFALDQI